MAGGARAAAAEQPPAAAAASLRQQQRQAEATLEQPGSYSALGAGVAAAAAVAIDSTDMTWILSAMVLLVFLYAASGICVHFDVPEGQETLAERFAHELASRWAPPRLEVLQEVLPALSPALIGSTADLPLHVPLGPLEARGLLHKTFGWSVDILSHTKKRMFTASLDEAKPGKPRLLRITGRGHHGAPDHVFASIDGTFAIRDSKGALFGKLIKEPSGEFVLEETGSRRRRWVLAIDQDQEFALLVRWRPRGRLLASGTAVKSRRTEYLQVMNSHGVDMVLVLTCMLGVIAFELAPQEDRKSVLEAFEEEASGLASGLLQKLHM